MKAKTVYELWKVDYESEDPCFVEELEASNDEEAIAALPTRAQIRAEMRKVAKEMADEGNYKDSKEVLEKDTWSYYIDKVTYTVTEFDGEEDYEEEDREFLYGVSTMAKGVPAYHYYFIKYYKTANLVTKEVDLLVQQGDTRRLPDLNLRHFGYYQPDEQDKLNKSNYKDGNSWLYELNRVTEYYEDEDESYSKKAPYDSVTEIVDWFEIRKKGNLSK